MLDRIEDKQHTAVYVDPPYFIKNGKYKHDFEPADHERLAAALHRFQKTRVVLSYYEHPKLDELYPAWPKIKIDVAKATSHQNKRGTNKTRAVEVLLCNQPIRETEKGILFK